MSEFNPSIHTHDFFKSLSDQYDGNKTKIAIHIGISRSTLYSWLERTKSIEISKEYMSNQNNPIDAAIRLISFENLIKYLEVRSGINRNDYLLGQITGDRKPLRSNTLLFIQAVRNMLEEYNHA